MNTNTKDIQTLKDQRVEDRIDIKTLYKKIVALEVKFDTMWDEQKRVRMEFKRYVYWVMVAVILDVILSIIFIGLHL